MFIDLFLPLSDVQSSSSIDDNMTWASCTPKTKNSHQGLEQYHIGDSIEIKGDSQHIIDRLLQHGYRPDGIAYLSKEYQLENKAKRLDEQVQKKHLDYSNLNKFQYLQRSTISLKYSSYVYSISEEYFSATMKTPFTTRLEELGDIVRLICAIIQIIIGDVDNLDESQKNILELKRRQIVTKNNKSFQVSQLTMQTIGDLVTIFGLIPKFLVDNDLIALENKFLRENISIMLVGNITINCEYIESISKNIRTISSIL
ncbi:unnamed protein product [Adineta ricciae]|uniref:Uncharacterized protein n=2 Tax=Adineta ricciae TaxID=249248 RepID=A0A814K4P7_ADIRI|nr:unnamed protein product [Adineta ricciae]